jgi:alpha-tubulin suppressor-like RCC1 family protein
MGDGLSKVNLGTGFVAASIAVGSEHSCARSTGGLVKCWGSAWYGAHGLGSQNDYGDNYGEMGDALPFVDLGPNTTVKAIRAAGSTTCVIFDNGRLKCWGANNYGNLGLGDKFNRGDEQGEMGSFLPHVPL